MGGGVGGMVYSIRNGDIICSHANHRGDVIACSDSNSSLTSFALYEAYGTRPYEWGEDPDRQKANTKEEETDLGLLNEGMRFRDLEMGVFLTRDPIGHGDGPNVYCYVHCNPIMGFDPLGLETRFEFNPEPAWDPTKAGVYNLSQVFRPGASYDQIADAIESIKARGVWGHTKASVGTLVDGIKTGIKERPLETYITLVGGAYMGKYAPKLVKGSSVDAVIPDEVISTVKKLDAVVPDEVVSTPKPKPPLSQPANAAAELLDASQAKRLSAEKTALVEMAKTDKKSGGITPGDMEAYIELNKTLPDPFSSNKVRGPEVHPNRPQG